MHNQQSKGGVGDRLLTCLVVGFCLVSLYNCIPIPSRLPFVIESCVASSIIAYVAGRLLNSKVVEKIFCFMKISIPHTLETSGLMYRIKETVHFGWKQNNQGNSYYGQVELIESHERFTANHFLCTTRKEIKMESSVRRPYSRLYTKGSDRHGKV